MFLIIDENLAKEDKISEEFKANDFSSFLTNMIDTVRKLRESDKIKEESDGNL